MKSPLEVRHEIALELLLKGQLEPEEALCAVVWPRNERLAGGGYTRAKAWPPELRGEAVRLYDEEELTYPEISQRLGLASSP